MENSQTKLSHYRITMSSSHGFYLPTHFLALFSGLVMGSCVSALPVIGLPNLLHDRPLPVSSSTVPLNVSATVPYNATFDPARNIMAPNIRPFSYVVVLASLTVVFLVGKCMSVVPFISNPCADCGCYLLAQRGFDWIKSLCETSTSTGTSDSSVGPSNVDSSADNELASKADQSTNDEVTPLIEESPTTQGHPTTGSNNLRVGSKNKLRPSIVRQHKTPRFLRTGLFSIKGPQSAEQVLAHEHSAHTTRFHRQNNRLTPQSKMLYEMWCDLYLPVHIGRHTKTAQCLFLQPTFAPQAALLSVDFVDRRFTLAIYTSRVNDHHTYVSQLRQVFAT